MAKLKKKRSSSSLEATVKCFENAQHDDDENEKVKRLKKKKYVVHVCRPEEVQKTRTSLPIVMMEQEIMEAINENLVVIICGETGSGKTTQLPQFLYEAGYGSKLCKDRTGIIGVTQPRRVAVLATAKRVAHELNLRLGHEVGFQVRHDRKIGEQNCIKFMTDGILLRELQADFLLPKYSVIVLDEAHERSINTDILIGMLSRLLPLRQKLSEQQCEGHYPEGVPLSRPSTSLTPLKLVIMSATMRVEDFTLNQRMFPIPPPVVEVPARQYFVTIHFSKKTELLDYETCAFKKVCAIHQKLPAGGVLVFLTGHREVESLCRRLRKKFSSHRMQMGERDICLNGQQEHIPQLNSSNLLGGKELGGLDLQSLANAVDIDDQDDDAMKEETDEYLGSSEPGRESTSEASDDDIPCNNEGDAPQVEGKGTKHATSMEPAEFESTNLMSEACVSMPDGVCGGSMEMSTFPKMPGKVCVLPLYAMLPAIAQLRVFAEVPQGTRLIVVATNVAETSLTIPGIRYVVDCGRAKERDFNRSTGISKFTVQWISKASAEQRAGRAGRTGPGHCYRLYSSAHFNNNFPDFSNPELSKAPLEGTILNLKCMGIDKVMNFPFPTPPERMAVEEAEKCLVALSALHSSTKLPTPTGKAMAAIPLSPRHARMLLAAFQEAQLMKKISKARFLIACSIAVAAALSLENPFIKDSCLFPEKSTAKNEEIDDVEQNGKRLLSGNTTPRNLHLKFFNPSSDAFSVVNALWAYEKNNRSEKFCRENFLHGKTMIEMSKLRKQLSHIVSRFGEHVFPRLRLFEDKHAVAKTECLTGVEEVWLQPEKMHLDPEQEMLLQRAICAGWADRVAHRLSSHVKILKDNSKHHKAVRYQSCAVEEAIFLHPSSSVSKMAPEYVVYNELICTSKPYMWGVTSVKGEWLVSQAGPLCTFSKPLADPPPWYDGFSDEVLCWVSPTFGPHLWQLPLCSVPLKMGTTRTCVFAFSLLQGKVIASLGQFRPYLSADPSMFLKPEGRVHKRVSELLHKLGTGVAAIDSKLKLGKMWEVNPIFLYEELLGWIQAKSHQQFATMWKLIREEAVI